MSSFLLWLLLAFAESKVIQSINGKAVPSEQSPEVSYTAVSQIQCFLKRNLNQSLKSVLLQVRKLPSAEYSCHYFKKENASTTSLVNDADSKIYEERIVAEEILKKPEEKKQPTGSSCQELYDNHNITSGVYDITLRTGTKSVYCDIIRENGWTVFLNRVAFDQDWVDYKNGWFKDCSGLNLQVNTAIVQVHFIQRPKYFGKVLRGVNHLNPSAWRFEK